MDTFFSKKGITLSRGNPSPKEQFIRTNDSHYEQPNALPTKNPIVMPNLPVSPFLPTNPQSSPEHFQYFMKIAKQPASQAHFLSPDKNNRKNMGYLSVNKEEQTFHPYSTRTSSDLAS